MLCRATADALAQRSENVAPNKLWQQHTLCQQHIVAAAMAPRHGDEHLWPANKSRLKAFALN
jgi:hypothetical protein